VSGVQFGEQQPSLTVPLHATPTHRPASIGPASTSIEASGMPISGATRPYVERWVVCAVAVPPAASMTVASRDHDDPPATARRTVAAAYGAMSDCWKR
jgi:hypothetical protein